VEYRGQKGLFQSRDDFFKVSRFSKKTFEQSAGFLRVPESSNPLDHTGVHPESYAKIEGFASKLGKSVQDLIGSGVKLLKEDPSFKSEIGEFTFADILQELEKPGRDPRDAFVVFQFRDDIHEVKDLVPGMICPGVVTNVTNFGAFVDVGVHQDGLVHISQVSDKFIKDPREVVSPGDRVKVRVLEVNVEKNQISLSMKNTQERVKPTIAPVTRERPQLSPSPSPRRSPIVTPVASAGGDGRGQIPQPLRSAQPSKPSKPPKPREAFNNPFGGLAALRGTLKPKG
jgi:uncharacterized protein